MLKNRMDADDVTQEVLIRIWKHLDNFEIKAAKQWIMKTTHNLCLDYLRKRQRTLNREYSIDDEEAIMIEAPAYLNDPEISVRREMLKTKIIESVNKLPETLKNIFVMYELQGFRYREISNEMNIPLNSVKVYLMRARKKLQEEIKVYKDEIS